MSGIRSKNTKPEIMIRSFLHRSGFRFRLHSKNIYGKPDIVLAKYRVLIFVHGCFWHGHNCRYFKTPKTREDFWVEKIGSNKSRDNLVKEKLLDSGWRLCIIWECSLKNHDFMSDARCFPRLVNWLKNDTTNYLEIQ